MRITNIVILQLLPLLLLLCAFGFWLAPATAKPKLNPNPNPQQSMVDVLTKTAETQYRSGNFREALRLYQQAKETAAHSELSDQQMATLLSKLAESQRAMALYAESEANFNQALTLMDKLPKGKPWLELYNDLGRLYMEEGRFPQAEALWKSSQSEAETDKAVRGLAYLPPNSLARLYFAWGKLGEGNHYLQQALTLSQQPEYKNCLAYPYANYNAGTLAELKGDYKDAEILYKEALDSCAAMFGTTHEYYSIVLTGLADLYRKESRFADAQQSLQEILKNRKASLSEDHPSVADAMVLLAAVLVDEGKYNQASDLVLQAIRIAHTTFGDRDNPLMARAEDCLGNIYRQDGRYDEAAQAIQMGLDIQGRVFGRQTIETADYLRDLAKVRIEQTDYRQAETLLKESKSIIDKETGSEHPERALSARALGELYLSEGSYAEAEPLFQQALELSQKILGEDNVSTAGSAHDLGSLYMAQKKYVQAQECFARVLKIDEKLFGKSAPQVAGDLGLLCVAVENQGNSIEAAKLTLRSEEIKRSLPGGSLNIDASMTHPLTFNAGSNRPVTDKWALAVGISNFKDSSINLKYAAKDATDFKNFLVTRENFKPDHVQLLTDANATRQDILDMLGSKWLAKSAHPDDLVVVYISSHGSQADKDAGGVNFLVAHDTDKTKLLATGIPMQWLPIMIKEQVHSNRVILILDVCHSGAAGGKGMERIFGIDQQKITIGSGQMILCSSLAEQVSWESKNYENSVFTRRLMEALQSNKDQTTMSEAYKVLKLLVESEVLRDRANLQTPVLWKKDWNGKDPSLAVQPARQ